MNTPAAGAYVQVNGLRMYYKASGEGVPVVLLHGGLETGRMWERVGPILSRRYRVITPDSRGCGRTDASTVPITYSLMAEDVAQLIRALGLDRPFVGGYSDGGATARHLAMNYPGLARGYLIGAIELRMTNDWRQMMQFALGFDGPGQVDFERAARVNPTLIPALQEKHDTFHQPGYWKTLLEQASRCWLLPPEYTTADFARICEPTLFWSGDRDNLCPPEQSLEAYRMTKDAELAIIPNADHFSMMAQIDLATAVLEKFMRRVMEARAGGS